MNQAQNAHDALAAEMSVPAARLDCIELNPGPPKRSAAAPSRPKDGGSSSSAVSAFVRSLRAARREAAPLRVVAQRPEFRFLTGAERGSMQFAADSSVDEDEEAAHQSRQNLGSQLQEVDDRFALIETRIALLELRLHAVELQRLRLLPLSSADVDQLRLLLDSKLPMQLDSAPVAYAPSAWTLPRTVDQAVAFRRAIDIAPSELHDTADKIAEALLWAWRTLEALHEDAEIVCEMNFLCMSEAICSVFDLLSEALAPHAEGRPDAAKVVKKALRMHLERIDPMLRVLFEDMHVLVAKCQSPLLHFTYQPVTQLSPVDVLCDLEQRRTGVADSPRRSAALHLRPPRRAAIELDLVDFTRRALVSTVQLVSTISRRVFGRPLAFRIELPFERVADAEFRSPYARSRFRAEKNLDRLAYDSRSTHSSMAVVSKFAATLTPSELQRSWFGVTYLQARLVEMWLFEYQDPLVFRWHVNAFLFLARSLTLWIQAAFNTAPGFTDWWKQDIVQRVLSSDPLLQKFKDARNIVVHARSLQVDSWCVIGLFKHGRKIKMTATVDVDPFLSLEGLRRLSEAHPFWFTDEMQQRGVLRFWRSLELGDAEITDLCTQVCNTMETVVAAVHRKWVPQHPVPVVKTVPKFIPPIILFPTKPEEEQQNGWSIRNFREIREHEVPLGTLVQHLGNAPVLASTAGSGSRIGDLSSSAAPSSA
jgi:hypothetical protein